MEIIAKEIGKWRPNLGRGLLAVTTADLEKRNAEALDRREEHRARRAEREADAAAGDAESASD